MEDMELSLGPPRSILRERMSIDAIDARKRKQHITWNDAAVLSQSSNSIDLHLINDPLPLDWEQCLDLQSGSMYYLNRKTMEKSWVRPKERSMDLELSMSAFPSSHGSKANNGGNMVALVCVNCHLLVMLCKTSPSCPNCKYLHPLPQETKLEAAKPLQTLNLLH
ncbi:hypothetical protein Cni_G11142 [Canna indica]|uniref:WW domain-containing protein n=1 Tax=Canna indica TaxID=4628 RepID=A0AAQ3K830_9LILI|nr:hypothetical protein Cni_G11142 [Canna indica]